MKKLIVIALLAALSALTLAACSDMLPGGKTPAATAAPAQETAEPTRAPATEAPAAEATATPAA